MPPSARSGTNHHRVPVFGNAANGISPSIIPVSVSIGLNGGASSIICVTTVDVEPPPLLLPPPPPPLATTSDDRLILIRI